MHDLLGVRGTGNGNQKYCLFTYKKIFEETIFVLDRSRYNGSLSLLDEIIFNDKNVYKTDEIVKSSNCFKKEKIIINNDEIRLSNARDIERKDKIILIPIDGISSFANGNSDFSMVLILQQWNDETNNYEIKNISIFNPVRKDVFAFDMQEGCKYNGKKLSLDNVYNDTHIGIIFVNSAKDRISFDLTKLAQIGNSLSISDSIFSALVELFTTNKNLCICKIDNQLLPFVEFAVQNSLLKMEKIGSHYVIGQENIVSKVVK